MPSKQRKNLTLPDSFEKEGKNHGVMGNYPVIRCVLPRHFPRRDKFSFIFYQNQKLSGRVEKPKRSIIFLAVTAEEQGLLGSQWYAENPIYPLEKTIANLNKDGANVHGSMKDLTITGMGHSELDELAAAEAKKQGRYVIADQQPEKGYFFRSNHFNFAKVGVPAFYGSGRYDHRLKGKEYAKEQADIYIRKPIIINQVMNILPIGA